MNESMLLLQEYEMDEVLAPIHLAKPIMLRKQWLAIQLAMAAKEEKEIIATLTAVGIRKEWLDGIDEQAAISIHQIRSYM